MFQRLKNKKGFTLIELIVVIAILGILALIAIPRFAGFTNRGRIAADEQYGALVANATLVIAASGELPGHAAPAAGVPIVIAINGSGVVTGVSVNAVDLTVAELAAFNLRLTPMVATQVLKYHTTSLTVTTSDSGAKSFVGLPAKP